MLHIDVLKKTMLWGLSSLACVACTAPAQPVSLTSGTPVSAATGATNATTNVSDTPPALEFETSERRLHPSGPIVRRYWRAVQDGPVLRMEIDRGLSGHTLVAGWSLLRTGPQTWQLRATPNAAPATVLPLDAAQSVEIVADDGVRWRVQLLSTKEPRAQPGIATEDEAWAQLRLDRLTPS